jgi:hypothetical protein
VARMRRWVSAWVLLAVACVPEPTQVVVVPGVVTWLEWPTAVTPDQPGILKISGYSQCGFRTVFGVSVSGREIRVTALGHATSGPYACVGPADAIVAGAAPGAMPAGYDTLLSLPALERPHGEVITYTMKAPMGEAWSGVSPHSVGWIESRMSVDTTPRFAGRAFVYADSTGCWWLRPSSRWPAPRWALKGPVPLVPRESWYSASIRGILVEVSPPLCGEPVAARAFQLEVDVTPWAAFPMGAR